MNRVLYYRPENKERFVECVNFTETSKQSRITFLKNSELENGNIQLDIPKNFDRITHNKIFFVSRLVWRATRTRGCEIEKKKKERKFEKLNKKIQRSRKSLP